MSVKTTHRELRDSLNVTEQEFYLAYKEAAIDMWHFSLVEQDEAQAKKWAQHMDFLAGKARVQGIVGERLYAIVDMVADEAFDEAMNG